MGKGSLIPPESRTFRDPSTGVSVRQITSHPSIHHHPFYYLPAYDDHMVRLIFVSHRTGTPQVYAEERHSRRIVQLTDRPDLNEWSIHPSHDGRFVYFTAGAGAWRVGTEGLHEEQLCAFASAEIKAAGMVAAGMGTTSLSRDDRWWAVPVRQGPVFHFHILDTTTGDDRIILERDTICHPQFHPDDSRLLRYGGPWQDRLWVIQRDGTGNRLVYERDRSRKEWIVHETWRPGSREILTVSWRRGMLGIDIDTGNARPVCTFNAWHPMIDRSGTRMVADTRNPDIGLQLFNPRDGRGQPELLCASEATSAGAHWDLGHCPYDDGVKDVYAPQHTHPHPTFSPDGRWVVFASDRSGFAQLYEADLSTLS